MTLFDLVDREQLLQGCVESLVFQSADGFFAVVRLAREPDGKEVVAIGDLGRVAEGETLRLLGRFEDHARHGKRFKVKSFTPILPSTGQGIIRYLGSGRIPGIGKGLAERLVQRFGERTLDVIATQSAKLQEVPGIGRQRAGAIAEAVRERRDEAELLSYLHSLGIGPSLAKRVRRRYREDAVRILREDPYIVAEQVSGVGFRTADRIGRASGIPPEDPRRAEAAVVHVLGKLADDGHVFATLSQLQELTGELNVPAENIESALLSLGRSAPPRRTRPLVVREDDAIYAQSLYRAECHVAGLLRARLGTRKAPPEAGAVLREVAQELTETQQEAVRTTLETGLLVLTGGPGTGKTTTVRGIVDAHRKLGHEVVLCAPTGRAAKRLSEAAGAPARTIHRLLEWSPATAGFQRDADNPIEADLVLVDESSMLNLQLAESLLEAIPSHIPLVLVGDVDQLPPVGAGQVLRDLIDSKVAPVVRLNQVFRQAQQSDIVQGAHAILAGRVPTPTPSGTRGAGELFLVRTDSPEASVDRVMRMLHKLPKAYGLDPRRDVQVLSPTRRGPLGTQRLNELLQEELNPARMPAAKGGLRPGDKVMQLRNDYDKETFNGDLGEVRLIQGGTTYVMMDNRDVRYKPENLDDLSLAYATTVHKVQGSEFPAVILVLHGSQHLLLTRALIYTAITRAKQLVVIVGEPRAIARAVRNADSYRCQSRLMERLRAKESPQAK